jgi:D-arabinose 1-dehydrogenase-like Zn-dependent alcohol dehydrogenase
VLITTFIRARDAPNKIQLLWGMHDGAAPDFTATNWRHGGLAEYALVPLENVFALNESRLLSSPTSDAPSLGHAMADLLLINRQLVGYAGLRALGVQAGHSVIIAPATGAYSGAAVGVAVAMGLRVVAVGRNASELARLQSGTEAGRVEIAHISGDGEGDARTIADAVRKVSGAKGVDAYLDLSPAQASGATYFAPCFDAVRSYGRVCLMGVLGDNVPVPYVKAVFKNLTIKAQYMFEREHVEDIIKLVESGLLPLGQKAGCELVGTFGLQQGNEALKFAQGKSGVGKIIAVAPWG